MKKGNKGQRKLAFYFFTADQFFSRVDRFHSAQINLQVFLLVAHIPSSFQTFL